MKNNIFFRLTKDKIFKTLVISLSFVAIVPLIFIIFYIFKNGVSVINFDFLMNLPRPAGEIGGGISNAIVGSLIVITLSSLISIPIGILTGIHLSENKESRISGMIEVCVEILQGTPSIVIGIIAYTWLVLPMKSFSAISGAVALSLMMLPIIIKTTQETFNLIPHSLKEAALALGIPYYKTIIRVIFPAALSGIITGILISITRVAGETAPLLFTAFGNPFMNYNIFKPVNSLPLLIFNYATSPDNDWQTIAWGASCVLILFILILNVTAKLVTKRWKVQF